MHGKHLNNDHHITFWDFLQDVHLFISGLYLICRIVLLKIRLSQALSSLPS